MAPRKRAARSRANKKSKLGGESKLSGRSLLIVDDDEAFTRLVSAWARRCSAKMNVARDGREALRRIQNEEYDALVVDLKMPKMDGYELHLRLAVEHPELLRRTVFVTGDSANPEAREFLARTQAPCLQKPFDMSELERAVQRVL